MRTSVLFRATAALLLSGVGSARAAFQAVDTFNALNLGSIGGQNGWVVTSGSTATVVVADPDNAANKVMQHTGTNDAYKVLPTPIPDGSVGTYFIRVRLGATSDFSFGLSDQNPPSLTDFGTYEVQPSVTNALRARESGGTRTLFTMTTGVWYNLWVVINSTTDTYRMYVQRDGDAAYATQTELVENSTAGDFTFRNGVAANPLVSIALLANSTGTNVYLDDIYIDASGVANLANPVLANSDADGDGLDDTWEIFYFGSTAAQNGAGDPDGDGATNEQEETAGSNPTSAASTLSDTDADGLADAWETTYFGNKSAQNGTGDPDGDGATNEQEETAGTSPVNAGSWPDSDGDGLNDAWEIARFGNLSANGSGDPDGDGANNAAEMAAGSDPNNANWSPTKAVLAHRWSFNGDLSDSVGTSPATIVDPDNNAAVGGTVTQGATSVTLGGGASATSAAVKLGSNLIGGKTTPVTLEFWATQDAVQNWGRVFDFGSATTEYLFMAWSRGTAAAQDRVEWLDTSAPPSGVSDSNAGYAIGTKYHIVMTLTPAASTNGALATGTRVTWYIAPSTSTSSLSAKGTFDTPHTLAGLNDLNNWIGRSMWASDNVASATYDEVRIWNGALTSEEINTFQLAGPNAFSFVDTDSDALSDPWEIAYFGDLSQNGAGDPDGDGYSNSAEYAGGSNPNQTTSVPGDVDGDGLADSWEISYFSNLLQTGTGDADGDRATNEQEETAGTNPTSNASWPDSDGDGLNDAWEQFYFGNLSYDSYADPDDDSYDNFYEQNFGLNPNDYLSSHDSDGDGLVDGWEIHYFKLPGETGLADYSTIIARQDGASDPDGDGFGNNLEYVFLTNPALNTSVPGDLDNDGDNDGSMLVVTDALGETSFASSLHWHDAAAPVAGKTYIVALNGLRTPVSGTASFAGDRLVLTTNGTNVGTLIWKTDSAVTIPVLQLDGGSINQAATNSSTVTLEGSVVVSRGSTLFANNGSFLLNASLGGTGDLTLTGNGGVTFAGASTWTGNLIVPAAATAANNRFTLAPTGHLKFALGASGVSNAITGAGVITLNGVFNIDATGASTTLGNTWTLVATTGAKTYGASFSLAGYAAGAGAVGSRQWTSTGAAPYFRYHEATGVLTVISNPDADGDGLTDAWEITYFGDTSRNGTGDFDNDGSTDAQEFAAGTNPTLDTSWPDTDADGVNDSWELATFGNLTTATITDKDGDGLLDTWEIAYFTTITAQNGSGDPDGDGHSNETEENAQSLPNLTASVPGDINADGLADGHLLLAADAVDTTSFNTGLNWSGAVVPAPGENYLVALNSLRTPTDALDYTFAGDRLVLFTGGNILVKGSGALTFPSLVLDGGRLHNGTNGNVVVTVAGSINVTRASEIFAQNQGFVITAIISGSGNLALRSSNPVTFAGVNTWTGSLAVTETTSFTLASTGVLNFKPGASGVGNAITGTRPVTLDGTFNIDTTLASTAPGSSWTLVATSGAKTYGVNFTVPGFSSDGGVVGARKWTKGVFEFNEATGVLAVASAPLTAHESWRVSYFGSAANSGPGADSADPDADGRPNLLEYALGTVPNVADSGAPTTVTVSGGVLSLTFAHIGDPAIGYVVEASGDLITWTTAHTYTGFTASGSTTYTDGTALSAGSRRFLRLKITAP